MNCYMIWCDLIDTRQDLEFANALQRFLGHLQQSGSIIGFRITRRKLGFSPEGLGDFQITIEAESLDGLDRAFNSVARRRGELESLHEAVYSRAQNIKVALYRDFPGREREE